MGPPAWGRRVDPLCTARAASYVLKGFSNPLHFDYRDLCLRKNVEPAKPFSGRFNLRITPELHRKIYRASNEEGKSINVWIKEKLESIVA